MKYLVDANTLSAPTKPAPDPRTLTWLRAHEPDVPIKDSLIAATAATHHLTVVTRNSADFVNAGVRVVDPFVA